MVHLGKTFSAHRLPHQGAFQSYVLDVPVARPRYLETTGLGAAFATGLAVVEEVGRVWESDTVWRPRMERAERERVWRGWNKAVKRRLNWLEEFRPSTP